MGTSTSPGRHPYRFRQCEVRSLLRSGFEGAGTWRLAVAQCGAVIAIPVRPQAKVSFVAIVPAGRTKRGEDLFSRQNFRQLSLRGTRLDDCIQPREEKRAAAMRSEQIFGRLINGSP